jgi:hypothetical protein
MQYVSINIKPLDMKMIFSFFLLLVFSAQRIVGQSQDEIVIRQDFNQEGGGADIGPLAPQGVPLIGFLPDSQRYFNYHHTPEDTFDKVDKRELELGAASMTALVYLIDQYGLR